MSKTSVFNTLDTSKKIVKQLMSDLSDRNGFDLGDLDEETKKQWIYEWEIMVQMILRKDHRYCERNL